MESFTSQIMRSTVYFTVTALSELVLRNCIVSYETVDRALADEDFHGPVKVNQRARCGPWNALLCARGW